MYNFIIALWQGIPFEKVWYLCVYYFYLTWLVKRTNELIAISNKYVNSIYGFFIPVFVYSKAERMNSHCIVVYGFGFLYIDVCISKAWHFHYAYNLIECSVKDTNFNWELTHLVKRKLVKPVPFYSFGQL